MHTVALSLLVFALAALYARERLARRRDAGTIELLRRKLAQEGHRV